MNKKSIHFLNLFSAVVLSIGLLSGCDIGAKDSGIAHFPESSQPEVTGTDESQGTAVNEEDGPHFREEHFSDAQLEFIQNEIGITTEDGQIVLFLDKGPIEDELDEALNQEQFIEVFEWQDDGLHRIRYHFCDDADTYEYNLGPEVSGNPADAVVKYPDICVFSVDMTNYIDTGIIEEEVPAGDWQALYNFFASDRFWSMDYAIIN